LVKNIDVPRDKHCLEELDNFKRYKKTDGHHVGKEQYPGA
jgi:hypothetical protein